MIKITKAFCYHRNFVHRDYLLLPWGFILKIMKKIFLIGSFLSETIVKKSPVPHGSYMSYVGWSGGAMVLGKLPVPGRPTIWIIEG